MPHVIVDFDPPLPRPSGFATDTTDLVYFLSWAYATRFGASHELSIASRVLRNELNIDLQPLLTFADRNVEDPDDEQALNGAWQDAAGLVACCREVAEALASRGDLFDDVLVEYPNLRPSIEDLGRIASAQAVKGGRIRITYEMEEGAG